MQDCRDAGRSFETLTGRRRKAEQAGGREMPSAVLCQRALEHRAREALGAQKHAATGPSCADSTGGKGQRERGGP